MMELQSAFCCNHIAYHVTFASATRKCFDGFARVLTWLFSFLFMCPTNMKLAYNANAPPYHDMKLWAHLLNNCDPLLSKVGYLEKGTVILMSVTQIEIKSVKTSVTLKKNNMLLLANRLAVHIKQLLSDFSEFEVWTLIAIKYYSYVYCIQLYCMCH